MTQTNDTGVYQLKNGQWGYRFCIGVDGHRISQRGKTDLNGNPLLTKAAAIKARNKAIKMAQIAPVLPQKTVCAKPKRRTVRDIFMEYCEKGRSDRAFQTIRKQDSIWVNHLDNEFGDRFIEDVSVAEIKDYRRVLPEDVLSDLWSGILPWISFCGTV